MEGTGANSVDVTLKQRRDIFKLSPPQTTSSLAKVACFGTPMAQQTEGLAQSE